VIDTYEEIFQRKGDFEIGMWFSLRYQSEHMKVSKHRPEVGWYVYFYNIGIDHWGFHHPIIRETFHEVYEEAKKIAADSLMMEALKKAARIGSEHLI
jgi:hypothetical protein